MKKRNNKIFRNKNFLIPKLKQRHDHKDLKENINRGKTPYLQMKLAEILNPSQVRDYNPGKLAAENTSQMRYKYLRKKISEADLLFGNKQLSKVVVNRPPGKNSVQKSQKDNFKIWNKN